ncbi:hypothetical protein [Phaeobacter sp. B1627]|uniref:hypothetical protein n=1 Tax=Phaeobacter sp. B1627 TaxID=2583809 RepID=UPI0011197C74|nr:hypothetical protein [Phaeobacter sp. B1627]TNJ47617.1 hypothetical protein FGE21_03375 [Phaeobacter sp. B1627]
MSDIIEIPKGARDQVLVFDLDMPPEQAAFLRDEDAALAQVLGIATLDRAQVEIFPVEDLDGLGLLGYLRDGLGVSEADLSRHGLKLDGLTGYVLVLRARAFDGALTRLTPADGVVLAARLGEAGTDWQSQGQIKSDAAQPRLRTAPRVARSRARTIGATLFAVVMALILLLIWVLAT